MKQTAVEFLYERLERMIPRTALYNMDKEDYFKQAKEMEKQQIEKMYSEGEVETIAKDAYTMGRNNLLIGVFNKWFEKIKKK